METINVFKRGDRVFLEYEIDSKFMHDDEIYYKLKDTKNGTYLNNAYTADELIPAREEA